MRLKGFDSFRMDIMFCIIISSKEFCFISSYCSLCDIEKANGYYLKSIKTGGMSPVEAVASNRLILPPLSSNQSHKNNPDVGKPMMVQNVVDRLGYKELGGKSNVENGTFQVIILFKKDDEYLYLVRS